MTISINQFKSGLTIIVGGEVYSIVDYEHVKPGKGSAFCRTRLRNLKTGQVLERTFRDGEKIEEAYVEEKKLQFLYRTPEELHFMDLEDYNQFSLPVQDLRGKDQFLKEGLEIKGLFYSQQLLGVELPTFVELKVQHTEPGFKGDTVKSGYKSAALETGAVIQVPLFIEIGDTIKIDTRNGQYVERV